MTAHAFVRNLHARTFECVQCRMYRDTHKQEEPSRYAGRHFNFDASFFLIAAPAPDLAVPIVPALTNQDIQLQMAYIVLWERTRDFNPLSEKRTVRYPFLLYILQKIDKMCSLHVHVYLLTNAPIPFFVVNAYHYREPSLCSFLYIVKGQRVKHM